MLKSILKIIGSFFLVLIIIFIGLFIWQGINSAKYEELATQFIEKSIPAIATWDYREFSPLLAPKAKEIFESERGIKVVKLFSKLGRLKAHEKPQFLGSKSGITVGEGTYDTITFVIPSHFEAGDAQITITLAKNNDSYLIYYININSDVFLN